MNKNKIKKFLRSITTVPLLAVVIPFSGMATMPVTALGLNQNQVVVETQVIITPEEAIKKERAEKIDKFFAARNAPLEGYGMKFVQEAEENDLDWRLLAAISVIESNAGKQACKKATNSVLGYGSCKMNFKSIDESIETVSMKIGGNGGSRYYHDEMTLAQILRRYNSVIPTYYQKVTMVMKMIDPTEEIG
jgi:hypothetical protein